MSWQTPGKYSHASHRAKLLCIATAPQLWWLTIQVALVAQVRFRTRRHLLLYSHALAAGSLSLVSVAISYTTRRRANSFRIAAPLELAKLRHGDQEQEFEGVA